MSRVSRNWERLVRAVLRTRPSGGGGRFPSTGLADAVPPSLVKSTNIDAILQAADEVQDEDPNIARIREFLFQLLFYLILSILFVYQV